MDTNEIVTGLYDPPPGAVTTIAQRLGEAMSAAYKGPRKRWDDERVPKTAIAAMYISRCSPADSPRLTL